MILIETERNSPKFGMGVLSVEKVSLVISVISFNRYYLPARCF